ncbi:NAD-dependent epimerase/dehydratase family protein [Aeromicrobium phragmitis]|uniref:NAD-dependent epimerase/dehydratase family protein n=1 Tax=Aeromicrobium phragmitis TaxID=2478914 RepID=A0A3L8PQ79_9ACTN|nr:NAD-dependent epimerase/dehydratase family protein [Aeromicrobium phragmitis]RLV56182.1 NAD-dependent epimerase/dehydratase family protein [Aeromicrobium phragmitis]
MTHLVLGAGPIGTTLALRLAERGDHVRLMTRSGSGPEHPAIERVVGDATDSEAVERAARGAETIHHCIHATAYRADVWRRELPAAERVVLRAAEREGVVVTFPESLYGMDAAPQPFTETSARTPGSAKGAVRVDLLAARESAPVRTVSMAASDYFGPWARANAHAGERMIVPILRGRTVRPLGSADQPHSFTYLPDLAEAMIRAAEDDRCRGLMFAPTGPPVTQRELITRYAAAAGVPVPKIRPVPGGALRALGRVHRDTRELAEMLHQWERPFVMDSTHSEAVLGLEPTALSSGVDRTIGWWRTGA